jgi:hypothetical protein
MKNTFFFATALVLFLVQQTSFGQGSLTPPGAPAPTMKTLAQIEARTPISSAPITITNSGSYYLTTNLMVSSGNAIVIDANNVTLDLNGFTISSTAPLATGMAIMLAGSRNVTNIAILNGFIMSGVTNNSSGVYSGSGFEYGIYSYYYGLNVRISHISVVGVRYYGIAGDVNVTVEFCSASTVGQAGISATTVSDSTAQNCGVFGVYAQTANNCSGSSSGTGSGISAMTANNCNGTSSGTGSGISATTANNCYGSNSGSGYGINVSGVATGCTGYSVSGTGVRAFIASVCHGTTTSGTGISATHNVNSY